MLKPIVFAFALGMLAACHQTPSVADGNATAEDSSSSERSSDAPSAVGRYVIVHSPQVERDTVLLDTITGRTWRLAAEVGLQEAPTAWVPMPQLNTQADYDALEKKYGAAPPGSKPPHWVVPDSN